MKVLSKKLIFAVVIFLTSLVALYDDHIAQCDYIFKLVNEKPCIVLIDLIGHAFAFPILAVVYWLESVIPELLAIVLGSFMTAALWYLIFSVLEYKQKKTNKDKK